MHFGRGRAVAVFQDHSPSPNFELILVWMASNQNAVFFFVIVDNSHLFHLHGWFSVQSASDWFSFLLPTPICVDEFHQPATFLRCPGG